MSSPKKLILSQNIQLNKANKDDHKEKYKPSQFAKGLFIIIGLQNRKKSIQAALSKWRILLKNKNKELLQDLTPQQADFVSTLNIDSPWLVNQLSTFSHSLQQSLKLKNQTVWYWRSNTINSSLISKFNNLPMISKGVQKLSYPWKNIQKGVFKQIKQNHTLFNMLHSLSRLQFKSKSIAFGRMLSYIYIKDNQLKKALNILFYLLQRKKRVLQNSFVQKLKKKDMKIVFPFQKIFIKAVIEPFYKIKARVFLNRYQNFYANFQPLISIISLKLSKNYLQFFNSLTVYTNPVQNMVKILKRFTSKIAIKAIQKEGFLRQIKIKSMSQKQKKVYSLMTLKIKGQYSLKQAFWRVVVRSERAYFKMSMDRICLYSRISNYTALWRLKRLVTPISQQKKSLLIALSRLQGSVSSRKLFTILNKFRQYSTYYLKMHFLYCQIQNGICAKIRKVFQGMQNIKGAKGVIRQTRFVNGLFKSYTSRLKKVYEQFKQVNFVSKTKKNSIMHILFHHNFNAVSFSYNLWKSLSIQQASHSKHYHILNVFVQANYTIANVFLHLKMKNNLLMVMEKMKEKWERKKAWGIGKWKEQVERQRRGDVGKKGILNQLLNIRYNYFNYNAKQIIILFRRYSNQENTKQSLVQRFLSTKTSLAIKFFNQWKMLPQIKDRKSLMKANKFQISLLNVFVRRVNKTYKQLIEQFYIGRQNKNNVIRKLIAMGQSQQYRSFKRWFTLTNNQKIVRIPNSLHNAFFTIQTIVQQNSNNIFMPQQKIRQLIPLIEYFNKQKYLMMLRAYIALVPQKISNRSVVMLISKINKYKASNLKRIFQIYHRTIEKQQEVYKIHAIQKMFKFHQNKHQSTFKYYFQVWKEQGNFVSIAFYQNPWERKCIHILAKHSKINKQIAMWRARDCIIVNNAYISKATVVIRRRTSIQKLFNVLRMKYETTIGKSFWMIQTCEAENIVRKQFLKIIGENIIDKSVVNENLPIQSSPPMPRQRRSPKKFYTSFRKPSPDPFQIQ